MEEKHAGFTLWFTGLPGAGKTSITTRLEELLRSRNYRVERLDGDTVRQGLSRDLGFSPEDRDRNIDRVTYVAKLLTRNDVIVLCAFIAPYRKQRDHAREEIGDFLEVYVDTPLEVCEQRDPKGMYHKARAGKIQHFTGVSDPYEPPEQPDIVVHTVDRSVEESAGWVLRKLEELGRIRPVTGDYTPEEQKEIEDRLRSMGYL